MLRKRIASLAVVMGLLTSGVIYPSTAVVTDVNYEADIVTVERANGFTYQFEGVEDLMVGDVMSLLMYNNLTPMTATDDEVLSARYSGWVIDDLK